jgi:hypothetical protein
VTDVTPEDLIWYGTSLKSSDARGGIVDTVKCIFLIIFQKPPKYHEVNDFVGSWIKNSNPIINILYPEYGKVLFRLMSFTENDFDDYIINLCLWRSRTNGCLFKPHQISIDQINSVLQVYNYPVYQIEQKITYIRKRKAVEV